MNQIRSGVGIVDNRWLEDNIIRRVGMAELRCFGWIRGWMIVR
jgi:hypothetical protein